MNIDEFLKLEWKSYINIDPMIGSEYKTSINDNAIEFRIVKKWFFRFYYKLYSKSNGDMIELKEKDLGFKVKKLFMTIEDKIKKNALEAVVKFDCEKE